MALATLDALTYAYPGAAGPALRDASLAIDGGLHVVAGPSGGGKSTLLRVFNGLVPHFHGGRISGRATVGGLDVFTTATRRLARDVGFVFQDPELQAVYASVDREVAFGLENAAVPSSEIPTRVEEALGTGADAMAAACPFCITMFEDGIKAVGAQERFGVEDISEILARALDEAPAAAASPGPGEGH